MTVNKYFTNYNSSYEQRLIEDLVVETIKIHGLDMYYLPRELNTQPDIFGDDPISSFRQHFIVEMFLETVDGFGGDGDFIGKFGLEIRDSATFVVSKKRFHAETSMTRPKEGDLLYFPLNNKLFEIKFVEHENPFYQLGKNYVYSLNVELFQFSEENIDTQIDQIDTAGDSAEYTKTLSIGSVVGSGVFQPDQLVYSYDNGATFGGESGANSTGVVNSYSNGLLTIRDTKGVWRVSDSDADRFVINTNGLYAKINSYTDSVESEAENDNDIIEDLVNDYLDFSEINPFGDMEI